MYREWERGERQSKMEREMARQWFKDINKLNMQDMLEFLDGPLEGLLNVEQEKENNDSGIEEEDKETEDIPLVIAQLFKDLLERLLVLLWNPAEVEILWYSEMGTNLSILNIALDFDLIQLTSEDVYIHGYGSIEETGPHVSHQTNLNNVGQLQFKEVRLELMHWEVKTYGIIGIDMINMKNCLIDMGNRLLWSTS